MEGTILKDGDIPIMDMDKSAFSFYSKLVLDTKINQNIDKNVNIYKKQKKNVNDAVRSSTLQSYSMSALETVMTVQFNLLQTRLFII